MSYAEFFEYAYRYISLAQNKKAERIPYDIYRPLMSLIRERPVEVFAKSKVFIAPWFEEDMVELELDCGDNDSTFLSLGSPDSEFPNTIVDWAKYGYPFDISYTPVSLFKQSYNDNRNILEVKTFEKEHKQEETTMRGFNFDFGAVTGDVRMSPYGIAVESEGTWKAFDHNTGNIVDVGDFTFRMNGAFFKMPVAIDSIQKGDMLIFKDEPVYVLGRNGDGFNVVDIVGNERKTIMPTTNIFGFNYMTKVVSLFDNMGFGNAMAPSAEHPFGNMMPLMMMQMLSDGDAFNMDGDMGKMMMLSMMMGGQNPMMNMFNQFAATPAPAKVKSNAVSDQS